MSLKNNSLAQVLSQYGLSQDGVFQDISEEGKVLWHNDQLAIKVVKPYGFEAKVSMVSLDTERGYMYFECPLSYINPDNLTMFVLHFKKNPQSILNELKQHHDHIVIWIANGESIRLERIAG